LRKNVAKRQRETRLGEVTIVDRSSMQKDDYSAIFISSRLGTPLRKASSAYSRPLSKARILWIKAKGHGHRHQLLVFFPDGMPVLSAPSSQITLLGRIFAGLNAELGASTESEETSRERTNQYRSTPLPISEAATTRIRDFERATAWLDGEKYRKKIARQKKTVSSNREISNTRESRCMTTVRLLRYLKCHKFRVSKRNKVCFLFSVSMTL
jgi:hypothetical protein